MSEYVVLGTTCLNLKFLLHAFPLPGQLLFFLGCEDSLVWFDLCTGVTTRLAFLDLRLCLCFCFGLCFCFRFDVCPRSPPAWLPGVISSFRRRCLRDACRWVWLCVLEQILRGLSCFDIH